jgi:multidrug resistance efflux pump
MLYNRITAAAICWFVGLTSAVASANDVAYEAEVAAARRDLAAAKIEARLYQHAEYECARRELNAEIRLSDAEVRTLRREFRRYGPFNAFAYGQQPAWGYRNAKLCLAEAEVRRRLLIEERNSLHRVHTDQLALLELHVADARARLVELEGGGVIELDVVKPQ